MDRLSLRTLDRLPVEVAQPPYDRASATVGVVHLGIGAFHRAHQADVFDRALAAGDPRWGIVGVSLRSPSVRDQLDPQNGLYTLAVLDGDRVARRVIGAVQGVLVAPEDPEAVIALMAAPTTHIVTLTVTEKGYKLDPATGALLADDPDIAADLAGPAMIRTAPGLIVEALARRRAAGLAPFTAISCDNLPHNGRRLENAVLAMARTRDEGLAGWIADHGAFPETMVDRIVPATTDADRTAAADRLGLADHGLVKAEPFTQWVIEERFCGPRPDFAALGVQLTDAVAPWEEAKLRLLNGAHSAIAYLGGLAGIDFVHQVIAAPGGRAFVAALWDEAAETLSPPPGLDIAAYRRDLMARFANAALQHRTRQIAMDGSQKLPQRLLATIAARRAKGLDCDALALGVAAWMRWQGGRDDAGTAFTVDDPLAAETARALAGCDTAAARVAALAGLPAIFPPALAGDDGFVAAATRQLERLERDGAAATLASFG